MGGTSKYLINGHRAQQQTVLHLFQSVQLNINNPNFLIMQGKITQVLNMKPSQILGLIEEAAGTRMFEDRKEKAKKTMTKKETKLTEIRTLLEEEIEPKLDKLRSEKRVFIEFQKTQSDLEQLSRIIAAHDYYNAYQTLSKFNENFTAKQDLLVSLETEVNKFNTEITNLKEDLEKAKAEKEKELKKGGKMQALENRETELANESARLTTTLELRKTSIDEAKSQEASSIATIAKLEKDIAEKLNIYEKSEKQYNDSKSALTEMKEEHSRKEELLNLLKTGISSSGATNGGYMAQLEEQKGKASQAKVSEEQARMKSEYLRSEIEKDKPKIKKSEKENQATIREIETLKVKHSKLEKQLESSGFNSKRLPELKKEYVKLENQIRDLEHQADNLKRRVSNLDFTYSKPAPNFDSSSVKGVAAQLFGLEEKNYPFATALEVCAGGRLFNIVIDTASNASKILQHGNLKKRVTIIPLDKIVTSNAKEAVKNAKMIGGNNVESALNLIVFNEDVSSAMQFIFGRTLICADSETAKKVTFNPNVRLPSVTVEGDYYDPSGTLSGGSKPQSSGVLVTLQELNQINSEHQKLKQQLKALAYEIEEEIVLAEKMKALQQEFDLTAHSIKLAEQTLEKSPSASILKKYGERLENIEQLQKQISEQQEVFKNCQQSIQKIEQDMNELNSDKGKKLKELQKEVEQLEKHISKATKFASQKQVEYQTLQIEWESLGGDLSAAKEKLEEITASITELAEECKERTQRLQQIHNKEVEVHTLLEEERSKLLGINSELKELETLLSKKENLMNEKKLESQKLRHEVSKKKDETESLNKRVEALISNNEWLSDEQSVSNVIESHPNINLDDCRSRYHQLSDQFQGMKRKVNPKVMNMIDNVEKKEVSLKGMIRTIEKDKKKIEETIETLNDYKRKTLMKTWEKVSKDFGNIFADLLPGSFAKLVPPEGMDVTEGLEVKVMLGKVWKESLVELSGGQRSLIALSLILALLQFKPAPMYILDEVDAALDLSHTQNIGHIIKTRFKGSQFIVVSLKEGFFSNANKVFRARFQDGTSVVSVM